MKEERIPPKPNFTPEKKCTVDSRLFLPRKVFVRFGLNLDENSSFITGSFYLESKM